MSKSTKEIIIISLLSLIVFNFIFGVTSFLWLEGLIINGFLKICMILVTIIGVLAHKRIPSPRLKYWFIIFSIFWATFYAQKVVKRCIEKTTEKKVEILAQKLENYRARTGIYPQNLNHQDFENIDLKHILNKKIQYRLYQDTIYTIFFPTFHQCTRVFEWPNKWYYED